MGSSYDERVRGGEGMSGGVGAITGDVVVDLAAGGEADMSIEEAIE